MVDENHSVDDNIVGHLKSHCHVCLVCSVRLPTHRHLFAVSKQFIRFRLNFFTISNSLGFNSSNLMFFKPSVYLSHSFTTDAIFDFHSRLTTAKPFARLFSFRSFVLSSLKFSVCLFSCERNSRRRLLLWPRCAFGFSSVIKTPSETKTGCGYFKEMEENDVVDDEKRKKRKSFFFSFVF